MTEPTEPPDSFTRLMEGPSGPLATAALILGVGALAMFFFAFSGGAFGVREIGPRMPPSLVAVNLSFCAMFMGIASVYRVRRLPRQAATRTAAILALVFGLIGPVIYSLQAMQWRTVMQNQELAHVQEILKACRAYASDHDGLYPPNLATLLAQGKLDAGALTSPFTGKSAQQVAIPASTQPSAEEIDRVTEKTDFEYVGADLRKDLIEKDPEFAARAIVAVAREPRMRVVLTIGFADGTVKFLRVEESEKALKANDEVREKAGLPKQMTPEAVASRPSQG